MQEIENLLDIIIKNNYKQGISLLQLLNNIYKIINIIKTSKTNEMLSEDIITYLNLYNKSSKIITLDIIFNCLNKNKIYKNLIKEYNILFGEKIEKLDNIEEILQKYFNNKKNLEILNLFSESGTILNVLTKIDYKYIECWNQEEEKVNLLKLLNNIENVKINQTDIIHSNDIKNTYDLIVAKIPDDIKNIIYTKCCSKIKELKIRGTKSEPLIIQLIMQLLKNDGIAIIKVLNSFLFGDSKQHIETRKFIYENCSEIEVIHLESKKTKSILILKKCVSDKIQSNVINFKYNNLDVKIDSNKVISNNYSFYYPNYVLSIDENTSNVNNKLISLSEIINIENYNKDKEITEHVLYSYNNYNFDISNKINKYEYLFITKNEELYKQEYLNLFLKNLLKNNIEIITKGKTKILDIEKIYQLKINSNLVSLDIQESTITYNNLNEKLKELNILQINTLNKIKNDMFYEKTNFIKLSEIATITNESDDKNIIMIYKNSNLAGTVNRSIDPMKSDNIYFINSINDQYSNTFIYNYLLVKENELINLANMNSSINLPKKYLESFQIPIIDISIQNKINQSIELIQDNINKYKVQYNNLINIVYNINDVYFN